MPAEHKRSGVETTSHLADLTIAKAAELLRSGDISPVELTRSCLDRIEERNPQLNAFITVTTESALSEARNAETEIRARRWRGPLHGIPIALKDLIDVAGVRTTAASAVLANHVAKEDAEIVTRLKQAGAVLIGKTNLHEFAYGGSSVISHSGSVRNARNPEHIAGGSSGGSATAVAAGMCLGAIGTDTAGSIRLPASFCGVVGLKPTYGLVSTRGVIPLAWSYDHVGPIAHSVTDAALILQVIAGFDTADIFSREFAVHDYGAAAGRKLERLSVGIPGAPFFDELDPEVSSSVERALTVLGKVAEITTGVSVPLEPDRTAANCESYAYHSQFISESASLYQPSTLERLRAGENVTAAQYIQAHHRLERMRRKANLLFRDIDVLVTPTVVVPPPTVEELLADLSALRKREVLMLRNTRPFNVLGVPAVTVPCGATLTGLPIGLQFVAAPGREDVLISVASTFEALVAAEGVCNSNLIAK